MTPFQRLFLCGCFWMMIAPFHMTASLRANPPAMAERKIPKEPSGFIRRFGSSAYRQMAYQLEYSPDGRWIAAGDYNQTVYVIDAKTGETRSMCSAKYTPKAGFAFSPDGRSIAIIDPWGVAIWDINPAKLLRRMPPEFNRESGYFKWTASSPDRQWRATMNLNNEILLTKWDQIESVHRIPFTSRSPLLAVGKEGKWVAAADTSSPVIKVWKAPKFDAPLEWKSSDRGIQSLACPPDGQTLYAGSADGAIHSWNIEKGREDPRFLKIDARSITSLVVSPDGKYLASGTEEGATIYETLSGRAVQNIPFDTPMRNLKMAFAPTGTTLALGSPYHPLELWDVKTGKAIHRPLPAIENVFAMQDPLRFGSTDRTHVHIWNRKSGQLEESFPIDYQRDNDPNQYSGGTLHGTEQLVIAAPDGLHYRDLTTGRKEFESFGQLPDHRLLRTFAGNGMMAYRLGPGVFRLSKLPLAREERYPDLRVDLKGSVSQCLEFEFSEDAQVLAAAFADHSIFVWDTKTGMMLHRLQLEEQWPTRRLLLSSDGRWLAVSHDDTVGIWDLKTGKQSHRFPHSKAQSGVMAFGFKENLLAAPDANKAIQIWDLATGLAISILPMLDSPAESLAFSPDGKYLAVGLQDKTIRLFDPNTKKEIRKLAGHSDRVTHLRFHSDGERLLSGSKAPEVFLWERRTGKQLFAKNTFRSSIRDLFWSPDGERVVVQNTMGEFFRFPAAGNEDVLYTPSGSESMSITDFAYSQTSQRLAVAYDTGIRIKDRKTGNEHPFVAEDKVRLVEWGPGGRILIAASLDLFGWDAEEQREVYRIPKDRLNGLVLSIAKSPDGQMVATGISNQGVKFWDLKTGRMIREIRSPGRSFIETLKFSPDGRLLFALAHDMYFIVEVETGLIWFQKPNEKPGDKSFALMEHHTLLSAEPHGTARLWSWAPERKDKSGSVPEELWKTLARHDGPEVYQAMFALAELKNETVEFLAQNLPNVKTPSATPEKVTSLIKDLEHGSPAEQRKASEELRDLGHVARSHLETALKSEELSQQARTRIELLLSARSSQTDSRLSWLRGIQLLEWIATPNARELLRDYADSGSPAGIEAKAALDRLSQSKQ